MNDKHIINEYFNTYYPKKKVFIHNEMIELLFGLFLGFFFSALKDTISNRAVQIVQRLDDPKVSQQFIKQNEDMLEEIQTYAKANKELQDKLKGIEDTLSKLQKQIKESQKENESDTTETITPAEAKKDPIVQSIESFTTQITTILSDLKNDSNIKQNQLEYLVDTISKNYKELGVSQQALYSKIESAIENAAKKEEIKKEEVAQIKKYAEITILPPSEETETGVAIEIQSNNFTATNKEGDIINFILINKSLIDISKQTIKLAFKNEKINKQKKQELLQKLNSISGKFLPAPIEVTINKKGEIFKDNEKTNIVLNNIEPQTIEISNPSILKDLDNKKSYKELFLQSLKIKKALPELIEEPKESKAQDKKTEQPKESKAQDKKLDQKKLEQKKSNLINKKFELNNLFNNLKLEETKDDNNYFGLKKIENDYVLFAKLTNYGLTENDINNISESKAIVIESKIIKYLFEAESIKIPITGEFSVKLSEQKINDIIETQLIQQNDINKLIDKIRKAFNNEKEKLKEPEKVQTDSDTKEPEESKTDSGVEEPEKVEIKKEMPDKWPKTLYFDLNKKSNGTVIGLKEGSILKKEASNSGKTVIKFNFKKLENNSGIYIGEINYEEKDNFTKTSLSSILETVILNQERKKQLTITVDFKDEKFIVSNIQKGKLTDSGSSTWQKLMSTGDIGANKAIAQEKFKLGKLSNNVITIKDYNAPITADNMILIFNIADKLLYLKLNEDDLKNSITTLRVLARQKQSNLNLYTYTGQKKTINNFNIQYFLSILPSIIEKIKQIYKDKYTKALNESRKDRLPQIIDSKFGFIGNFDIEKGFKDSYNLINIPEQKDNTPQSASNNNIENKPQSPNAPPSIDELEKRSNSLKQETDKLKSNIRTPGKK